MRKRAGSQIGRPPINLAKRPPIMIDLYNLRVSKNISLDALSRLSGYSLESIGRWERGEVSPTLFATLAICNALGVDLKLVERQ